jgi:hypothetical protein
MRTALPTLALLVLVAGGAPARPAGEVLSPGGGRFSVRFPGKPKETTQTAKTPIGDLKVYTATYATADGNVYLVSYTDFPAEAIKAENHATLFNGVREGLAGKDGKVVKDSELTVGPDKAPGREIVIDKGKQQTRFRVVVKDTRLFQVAAVGTGEFVTGTDATAFLDSFELVK